MASKLRVSRDSRRAEGRTVPWRFAVLCAVLCALPWTTLRARSQNASNVATLSATGEIRTVDGAPVPGATLRLTNEDTQKVWISWSDQSGKFGFPSLPPGHYKVEATQLGFQPATVELEIASLPEPHFDLVLRVATLAELSATPGSTTPNRPRGRPGAQPTTGQNGSGQGQPEGPGRRGRGQQLPPGLQNAVTEGMAGGGFQQTDITTDDSATGQENGAAIPGAAEAECGRVFRLFPSAGHSWPGLGFEWPRRARRLWRPRIRRVLQEERWRASRLRASSAQVRAV